MFFWGNGAGIAVMVVYFFFSFPFFAYCILASFFTSKLHVWTIGALEFVFSFFFFLFSLFPFFFFFFFLFSFLFEHIGWLVFTIYGIRAIKREHARIGMTFFIAYIYTYTHIYIRLDTFQYFHYAVLSCVLLGARLAAVAAAVAAAAAAAADMI